MNVTNVIMIIADNGRCVIGVGDGGATVKKGVDGGAAITNGDLGGGVCVTALKAASAPAMRVFHEGPSAGNPCNRQCICYVQIVERFYARFDCHIFLNSCPMITRASKCH